MNRIVPILIISLIVISCGGEDSGDPEIWSGNTESIKAVDISSYPEIAISNPVYYDLDGNQKDFLVILKESGVNTIRLRLWVNPVRGHSGLEEVKRFATTLKEHGFKIWLALHYSDSWADPGQQEPPSEWQDLGLAALKDSVYHYTARVVNQVQPSFIQIGNEINAGMLHPKGNIETNFRDFTSLVNEGCAAVRDNSSECQIILHFAGLENAAWFFSQVSEIDYDIIGLSYYPIWHGNSISTLKSTLQQLDRQFNKEILIAETAYPFTLAWNDWTNNIVGLEEQLILPEYPATPEGQSAFIRQIRTLMEETENGLGFCYWGAELIAWKGAQSTEASPWENQALFDFDNKALPALNVFKGD
ncbi:MAG: glycosyl hydrolase 53 family protein [Bacteroidota bacterium]